MKIETGTATPEQLDQQGYNVYLAGPMFGIPYRNYPAFHEATADLVERGFTVSNPADAIGRDGVRLDVTQDFDGYQEIEGFDLKQIFINITDLIIHWADALVLLDGWEASPGALAEAYLARAMGLKIFLYSTGAQIELPFLEPGTGTGTI